MTTKRTIAALLGAALLAGALPAVATAQEATTDASDVEGMTWELASYSSDGSLVDVPGDVMSTLLLEDGQASGSAGCNSFSGTYEIDTEAPGTIGFGEDLISTQALCEGPVQEVEDAYLALLPQVTGWEIVDGALELSDSTDGAVLVFADGSVAVEESDIDAILAGIAALREQVGDLQERVATLEDDGESTKKPADKKITKPKAPDRRGKVETRFPAQDEDPLRGLVKWNDRAKNETGFRVYARLRYCELKPGADPSAELKESDFRVARGPDVRVAELLADKTSFRPRHATIVEQLPEKPASDFSDDEFYDVLVSAYNSAGESKTVRVGSYFLQPEFSCP